MTNKLNERYSKYYDMLVWGMCDLVKNHLYRKPEDTDWKRDKALLFQFRLKKHKTLSMLVYAPSNYIKVITKISKGTPLTHIENKKILKDFSKWKLYADHDSCWRGDGIERVMREHVDEIEGYNWLDSYEIVNLTPAQQSTMPRLKYGN